LARTDARSVHAVLDFFFGYLSFASRQKKVTSINRNKLFFEPWYLKPIAINLIAQHV